MDGQIKDFRYSVVIKDIESYNKISTGKILIPYILKFMHMSTGEVTLPIISIAKSLELEYNDTNSKRIHRAISNLIDNNVLSKTLVKKVYLINRDMLWKMMN